MKKILFCFLFCFFCLGCGSNNDINKDEVNFEEDVEVKKVNDSILDLIYACNDARYNGDFQKALDLANQIIEINKGSSIGYCELALAYYGMEDIDKAKEAAEHVANQMKSYLLSVLCKNARINENFNDALKYANQIIEIDKDSSIGYCELAITYYVMKDIDKAKKASETALEKNPNDSIAQNIKKWIETNGSYEEKNRGYNEINVNELTQFVNLIDSCNKAREEKNYEQALDLANQIIESSRNTDSSIGYCNLALIYSDMGDIDKAKEIIEKISAQIQMNILSFSCHIARNTKDYQTAIELANKIIELNANNERGYSELAVIYYNMGDINKANELLEKALEINPNSQYLKYLKETNFQGKTN